MANRIQLRRGNGQEWQNSNPILAQGELGIELDTGRFKIGDGVTPWNTLRYERPIESTSNTANTLVQRDNDGNFSAATITATIIGNASTASRLASSRQIQLIGDVSGSQIFDGSENISISAALDLLSSLPHHDNTDTSSGTYTKVTVDAKGRVTNASNPTTLADYNLNGTVEGSSAQAYDLDLVALAGLTTTGFISRTASNTMATRTITGTAGKINVNNGGGLAGNPTLDLATTTVVDGDYNTESLTSVSGVGSNSEPFGTETVNAVKFSVDDRGRLTSATNVPIATATQGTTAAAYNAATTYVRGDQITNASKLYQAIAGIAAGAGAPTHSDTSDAGSWRHLGAAASPQKGLASFDQEDFDVTAGGHVTMALGSIDNDQLQNSRVSFADGNDVEHFDLDQELTATTGYRGFNKLNYIKVNDTSGNLLFGANNTGDGGAGEVDINSRLYFSDADITLDGAVAQTLDKTGDGNLTFQLTQNSTSARSLSILATNAGSGASNVVITAEDKVTITASEGTNGKVQVEDTYFQGDYIASSAATMILDPGDDRAVSGKVQIMGDLQVDGTTTTINSTITTLDDPIITLGGDTAPGSDDNKDRGVEFRYYDASAKVGFFGYDDSANDLGGHTGAFTFLYDATNSSEVFSGTDAGIIAGNLKLTTNTNSTSNTTGDLVVAGGVGIGDDVNIGGLLDVDGTFRANSTSRFDDNIVFQGASKTLELKNGSGTTKTTLHTTTGNVDIGGVLNQTGNIDAAANLNVAGLVHFESADNPDIVSGAPHTIQNSDYGALRVDGGGYFEKDVLFNGDIYLNGDFNQQEDATENYGLRNYLSVRYKLRAGSVGVYTPSYSNHNTSNLRVFGGAGVNTTLHVGATGAGQGLFVGKKNSGDTVKFSVDGPSGNVDTSGTLVVAGQTTINDSLIINAANEEFAIQNGSGTDKFTVDTDNGNTVIQGTVNIEGVTDIDNDFAVRSGTTDKFKVTSSSGNTNIEGTLTADGHTELNSTLNVDSNTTIGGTLEVTNNSEFNGTVDVDNDFAVRSGTTDKFTVASSSGNTATDGTLVVAGQTTINDSLIVQSDNEVVNINNGSGTTKFSIDTDNGNTNIIGTLTVGDATQINDTLGVSNVVTFTRNTQQTLTGSYAADGAFQLTGGAAIGKNVAIGEGLRVYGGTELTGALDLNNSADISGALVTHDNVTITADNKEFAIQNGSAADKFTVDTDNGNTDIRGTLDVGGDVTAESNLTITGNLTVNGTTTTVNSTITTYDDPVITLGGDTAPGSNDGKDRGVEFRYYDGSAKIGFFGYDRSSSQFAFLTSATNTSEVLAGTDGALRAGSLNLTAAGTALDVDNDANIDGALTVDGQIVSNKSSGAPFSIASTTKVNNLNVDLLDGMTTASANTASTVVNRDASGDFAANIITAALVGNVTGTVSSIANHDTADLAEGTNLYFTNERVDDRVNALIVAGTGITKVYDDAAGTYTLTVTQADVNTDNVTEGSTNLFTTAARTRTHFTYGTGITHSSGTLSVTQSDINTDNVTEGSTNLFTTAARTRTHFTYGTGITHSSGTLSVTQADINTDNVTEGSTNLFTTAARTRTHFTYGVGIKLATADLALDFTEFDTDNITEGSTNLYYTDARADARADAKVAAATGANLDLSSKSTTNLSEGTNQYYTEARVQAKLDNAFEQLSAMLNNLATSTTLTLALSGDPTPGAVVTTGVSVGGGGGFTAGTGVATTGGTGSSLTVNTTVVGGAITAAVVNAGGSGYLISDTVTVTNPNAGKVLTLNLASLAGGSNYVTGTALATTGGSGSASLTVDITAVAGAITNVTINNGGTGYAAGETITIVQPTGLDGSNPATGGTVATATVATNATLTLTDITTMEVGATVTGATSGTTGVVTALGTNQITVDNVDGFFKKGEVVSANDVTTLTISSFS